MGDSYTEEYSTSYSSDIITAGSNQIFGGDADNRGKRDRYGSMNSLVLSSIAVQDFDVILDNNRRISKMFARGGLVIKPEDGIYFDTVQLVNLGATDTLASDVNIKMARSRRI